MTCILNSPFKLSISMERKVDVFRKDSAYNTRGPVFGCQTQAALLGLITPTLFTCYNTILHKKIREVIPQQVL